MPQCIQPRVRGYEANSQGRFTGVRYLYNEHFGRTIYVQTESFSSIILRHWFKRSTLFNRPGEKSTSLFDPTSFVRARPKDCVPDRVLNAVKQYFDSKLELILTESISRNRRACLEVDYEVTDKTDGRYRLGPAIGVRRICRGSGLVTCSNDGCQLSQAIVQDLAAKLAQESSTAPVCQVTINNSTDTIFDGDQIALLIAAFGCWGGLLCPDWVWERMEQFCDYSDWIITQNCQPQPSSGDINVRVPQSRVDEQSSVLRFSTWCPQALGLPLGRVIYPK